MTGLNLLVVEDDLVLAEATADELRALGHSVTLVRDGGKALQAVASASFHAILLDRMLPRLDGVSVVQQLRDDGVTIPVVMVSALGKSAEKVEGLEAGADDYVAKPAPAAELIARIQAALRARDWKKSDGDTLQVGDITVSPTRFRAWRNGRTVDLPKLELNLLIEFARNPDTVLTRAMLLERVWGYDFEPSSNLVESYVRRLRARLTSHGEPDPIQTLRGVGYMLRS